MDDEQTIRSRYADLDGVVIDPDSIPGSFRHLLPDALEWSIGDDVERDRYMAQLTEPQLQSFDDAIWPHMTNIGDWCRDQRGAIPVPDAVIVFDHLTQSAAEARVTLDRIAASRDA
ncbi:hypothetical protein RMSM_01516 [Rhodopirellula maiorica SM1]|uniref:Uncharacterized protein n=1 Tax=Rhodopirellula maiorica SM1 TaxID=1265738 RepID=M5RQQ6_9BACT|nr:hypothetical protein [Rhodopirellula maiorica]EMI21551.1 hypothetical protein RMSM_01516 [Rhodopirellula maiorica SM1]